MAVRSSQTIFQVLSKPTTIKVSQTILQVMRRIGDPETEIVTDSMAAPPEPTLWSEPALPQPPTTIANLVSRVQRLSHDLTETCFGEGEVRAQLLAEVERLARQQLFGDVIWMQAIKGKATYDLEDAGLFIALATANGTPAEPADVTTVVDSNQAFITAGVQVGDRVRNLSNGCLATVTSVESQDEIVCGDGFMHPQQQIRIPNQDGDQFVIERPVLTHQILGIRQVLYNAKTLAWYHRVQFDRLHEAGGLRQGVPRYWSTDTNERPTQIRVFPAPQATGEATLVAPMNPHSLVPYHNFLIMAWINPHPAEDSALSSDETWLQKPPHQSEPILPLQVPRAFHTPLVYRATANLLLGEGPCQNLPVAMVCGALADMYLSLLGVD